MSYTLETYYKGYKILVNCTEEAYIEEEKSYLCFTSFECSLFKDGHFFMSNEEKSSIKGYLNRLDDIVNDNRNKYELGKEEN